MDVIYYFIYILLLIAFIYSILCFVYLGKLQKSKDYKNKIPSIFPKNGIVLAILGGLLLVASIVMCGITALYSNATNLSIKMNEIRNHKNVQYPY